MAARASSQRLAAISTDKGNEMLLVVALSTITAIVLCHFRLSIAHSLRIMDKPDGVRKLHKGQTPLVGGVAIIFSFVLTMSLLAIFNGSPKFYLAFLWLAVPLWVLGCLDDRLSLRPLVRLIASTCVVLPLIMVDPRFAVTALNFGADISVDLLWFSLPFTVVGYLALQNAVNMADGMNGVVGSTLLSWCAYLAWKVGVQSPVFLPLLALAGAIAVALVYNLRGRLFLGDNGSYSVSIVLGAVLVFAYNDPTVNIRAEEVILVLFVPVVDATRLIIVRTLAGVSPFQGDRNHLHHILQRRLPWSLAIATYGALVSVPLALSALGVDAFPLLVANLGAYMGILLVCRAPSSFEIAPSHMNV